MKVLFAIFALCLLVTLTTLLPSLADPDNDLPLHLQPLNVNAAGMKHARIRHSLTKRHPKHSLFLSMSQEEFHGPIPSRFGNAH